MQAGVSGAEKMGNRSEERPSPGPLPVPPGQGGDEQCGGVGGASEIRDCSVTLLRGFGGQGRGRVARVVGSLLARCLGKWKEGKMEPGVRGSRSITQLLVGLV